MKLTCILCLSVLTLALTVDRSPALARNPAQAQAQDPTRQARWRTERETKRKHLTPYVVSNGERRLRQLERVQFPRNIFVGGYRGFRPLIGGMPSGSGFVVGAGHTAGRDGDRVRVESNARVSTYGYTQFDASARFPVTSGRVPVLGYVSGEVRDLKALNFFGRGSGSSSANSSTYRLEDRSVTAGISAALTPTLTLGADGRWLRSEASPGTRRLSLERRFDVGGLPGFGLQTSHYHWGGYLELDLLDSEIPAAGLRLRVDAQRFENRDGDAFNFDRVIADVHGYLPLGYRNRMLAIRLRTSHSMTQAGQHVPFYLMETLGGAATLRGFREYRFRDTRNLLLNVEYRWEVWTYVDFSLFYDAGKVFSDAADLDFRNLRSGYGFGIRAHTPRNMVLRFDLARSNEGFRLHVGGGPSF